MTMVKTPTFYHRRTRLVRYAKILLAALGLIAMLFSLLKKLGVLEQLS